MDKVTQQQTQRLVTDSQSINTKTNTNIPNFLDTHTMAQKISSISSSFAKWKLIWNVGHRAENSLFVPQFLGAEKLGRQCV